MKNRHPNLFRILLTLCCLALALAGCRSVEDSDGTSVATIKVTPSDTTMETGKVLQLTAEKLYTNATSSDCSATATWTSSNTSVASFSTSSNGLLSALTAGTTTVTVTCGGTSKSYTMTVTSAATLQSIEISPVDMYIAPSSSIILIATGVYSDGTTVDLTDSANWSSNTPASIKVERSSGSNSIQATAQAVSGSATITAEYGGVTGTSAMTIRAGATNTGPSIYVTPVSPNLAVDSRLYIKAVMKYDDNSIQEVTDSATWSSSSDTVATVSNVNNGLTRGVSAGSANITATLSGVSSSTATTVGSATLNDIEVYPKTLSMDVGTSAKLTAIGIYSDNTTIDLTNQVTWSSSNTSVLGVSTSNRYNVRLTTLTEGTAVVTASLPNTTNGAAAIVTVTDKTLSSIEVTPGKPSVPANLDVQFKATGIYSDSTTQDLTDTVVWSSSATSVLKISNDFQNRGIARTITSGSATVTASLGTVSGTSTTTVSTASLSSVSVTPSAIDLPNGYKQQFKATGIYSDGSTQDLTSYVAWQSDNTNLVMENMDPWQGVATATASGLTGVTVSAYFFGANNQSALGNGSVTLDTTTATLSTIEITPTNSTCMKGLDISFEATGVFSDSTQLDMTPFVVWKSSGTSVATANNVPGSNGKFHCVSSGSITVTAASGSTSGTTTLYVADQ